MSTTPYEPFDQDRRLPPPPWSSSDPAVVAWEEAHGHDVRLKCYVEFGCQVIEPTLERKIERLEKEKHDLIEAAKSIRAEWLAEVERLQEAAVQLTMRADDYKAEVERLRKELEFAHTMEDQADAEVKRLRTPSEWTREESKEFLFEATKASYAEGVRAGCEELSIHAADMDVEIEGLRAELHQAKAEWFEEKKRARELEEENEMLRGAAGALGGGV